MSSRHSRNPLSDWIRANLANPEYGPCTMLELVYERRTMTESVQVIRFTSGQWKPEELSDRLYSIAKEHIKDDKGVEHRFVLCAFYDGKEDEPKIRKRFNIVPYGDDGDTLLQDAPDARGGLAQGMRLTEQLVQGTFKLLGQVVGSAAHENEVLRDKNMQMFEMMQNLMTRITMSEHDKEMERLKYQRETDMMKQAMTFAPVLVNTILGKDVFPASTVDTTIIEAAAENLSEDDLAQLASKMPAHLWGPLASRLESVLKAKREKEEERQKILKLVPNTTLELGEGKKGKR